MSKIFTFFFFSLKTIIHNLYEKKTPWAKCLTRGAKEKKKRSSSYTMNESPRESFDQNYVSYVRSKSYGD